MATTVKAHTKIGIDERVATLRLQLVASSMGRRIGVRIRERRKELGLTQKQVAARMPSEAVDAQRVSDWERAYNQPSSRYLEELVGALEIPDISYFYEAPEPQETPDLFAVNGDDAAAQLATLTRMVSELAAQLQDLRGETAATAAEVLQLLDDRLPPSAESQQRRPA